MEQEQVLDHPSAGEEEAVLSGETEGEADTPEPELEEAESEIGDEAEKKPQPGINKRIGELTRRVKTSEELADYWRHMALQSQKPPETPVQPATYPDLVKPRSDDFETDEEFVEALVEWKAEVKQRQWSERQDADSRQRAVHNWHGAARAKYVDWDRVFHDNLPVSTTMAEVLLQSEAGVDVAYHLGQNPAETQRIANLPPSRQAYELGRLETKLANQPPPQRTQTKAPAPTSPVGGKETPAKKPEDMTLAEYEAWRDAGGGR